MKTLTVKMQAPGYIPLPDDFDTLSSAKGPDSSEVSLIPGRLYCSMPGTYVIAYEEKRS